MYYKYNKALINDETKIKSNYKIALKFTKIENVKFRIIVVYQEQLRYYYLRKIK